MYFDPPRFLGSGDVVRIEIEGARRDRARGRLMRALLAAILGLALAAPAAGAATNPWIEKTPLDIAHQGGEDEFPSNTMYAFKRALQVGADMLELDVGVTKDGQVVVVHDTTVDRTTNGQGTVASFTLKKLRKLDAAYWFSGGDNAYSHNRPQAYRCAACTARAAKARADFRARRKRSGPSRTLRSTSRSRAARRPRRSTST